MDTLKIVETSKGILSDIRQMIEQTRSGVSIVVNSSITLLNWKIGKRIQSDILQNERADYWKEILATLSQEWRSELGHGMTRSTVSPTPNNL